MYYVLNVGPAGPLQIAQKVKTRSSSGSCGHDASGVCDSSKEDGHIYGRVAQLEEHYRDMVDVGGSSPLPLTKDAPGKQLFMTEA